MARKKSKVRGGKLSEFRNHAGRLPKPAAFASQGWIFNAKNQLNEVWIKLKAIVVHVNERGGRKKDFLVNWTKEK